jgi:acetylornithine deacetylase/succinyl-diaminopimelate desuccinylase-like protein
MKKRIGVLSIIILLLPLSSIALFQSVVLGVGFETYNSNFEELPNKVNIENLKHTITHLQSYGDRYTWEKQCTAAEWAVEQFKKAGTKAEMHYYEYDGKNWPNVIAQVPGTKHPDDIIMLLAHIDSISDDPAHGAPGANDNASGVAVLLETARIIAASPLENTVFFCIFTNEERGTQGSKAFAKKMKKQAVNITAVINMDVIGYNRPEKLFYFDAVTSQITLKHKAKALTRMVRNYYRSFEGDNIIKIAGRVADQSLLSTVAEGISAADAGLNIKELIDDGCG